MHAVSVGEVISSVRLIGELRRHFPGVWVSTTTLAGRSLAQEKLAGIADGVFYAPIDYCFAVRRVLRAIRPSVVVVLETEIWPNLWREAKRTGAALVVVNGRISDRAMSRYRGLRWFFSAVVQWPDRILAQSELSAARYRELGATAVECAGNLKYDFEPRGQPAEAVARFLAAVQPGPVWIAASTMPPADDGDVDEDDAVLDAFTALSRDFPRLLLLLVPRREERFNAAAANAAGRGIRLLRRSALSDSSLLDLPGVLLIDTVGELDMLFPLADVVFMGGTLARRGGHNLLEPAFFGKPVISGPHLENFPEIAGEFRTGGALVEIGSTGELADTVRSLLNDPARRREVGERGRRLAEARRGATARAAAIIGRLGAEAFPRRIPPSPLLPALWCGSRLWELGAACRRRWDTRRRRRLSTPVISVGGIAMGGSGKTPFVAMLAGLLRDAGLEPAILTRGYRRQSAESSVVLAPGQSISSARTGDEAQILLRAGVAAIGIGADRYQTGRLIERTMHPAVMILDDGFQHWRLERDLDIVLVDSLDPFAGGAVFPLGRLREPPSALARADVIVLARAEPGVRSEALERELRKINPCAPVFRARVAALGPPPCAIAAAFCGLGNPESFWRTLAGLGPRIVLRRVFPDHHRYSTVEIATLAAEAMAAGAKALLTTEKDWMNLPEPLPPLGLPLVCLKIEMRVDRPKELIDLIRGKIPQPAMRATLPDRSA